MKSFIVLLVIAFIASTQAAKGGWYAKPPAPLPPAPVPVPEPEPVPSVGEPVPAPQYFYKPRKCPQTEIEICIKIKPVKRRGRRPPMPAQL